MVCENIKDVKREMRPSTARGIVRTPRGTSSASQKPPQSARAPKKSQTPRAVTSLDLAPVSLKDPRYEVHKLVSEATRSTSTQRKNTAINKLGEMLVEHMNRIDMMQSDNARLTEKIESLESQIEAQSRKVMKIEQRAERVQELRHLKTFRDDETMIEDIKKIEGDISKFSHLSEPWLLEDILNDDPETRLESLVNLKLRRLEDLIYGLRKQSIQDQEVNTLFPRIVKEFGSLNGLLVKYEELQKAVASLKLREIKYVDDEFARRRPLSEYSTQGLHLLIIALQNELACCRSEHHRLFYENFQLFEPVDDSGGLIEVYKKQNEDILKDIEFMKQITNLETDCLSQGIFKTESRLREAVKKAEQRITQYHTDLNQMQEIIAVQKGMISQLQKEQNELIKAKQEAKGKRISLQLDVERLECELNTATLKANAMRDFSRILSETALVKRDGNESIDSICNAFVSQAIQYDQAAIRIQRAWRHQKQPPPLLKMEIPITEILCASAVDVVHSRVPPSEYKRIVSLIHQSLHGLRSEIERPIRETEMMLRAISEKTSAIVEKVVCRGRRFAWTQTEKVSVDVEVQTERFGSGRKK